MAPVLKSLFPPFPSVQPKPRHEGQVDVLVSHDACWCIAFERYQPLGWAFAWSCGRVSAPGTIGAIVLLSWELPLGPLKSVTIQEIVALQRRLAKRFLQIDGVACVDRRKFVHKRLTVGDHNDLARLRRRLN
jgi:hypothetical protein